MQKTKLLFTCIASMLFFQNIFAQRCGTQQHQQMIEQQDPKSIIRRAEIEQFTADFAQQWDATGARAIVTIPVVVHVVYNTGTQNISDAQIQTQIDRLNLDYHKLNTDWTSTPSVWQSLVADVGIQFCLASRDPNGNSTTGITRTATSVTSFSTNDAVKYTSAGGRDAWPRSSYLNIWVCNLSGGLLGYAQTPGGPAATDGVVITYQGFGQSGTATYPYNKGRTATHEVGHWLNLEHIWGDDGGSCSGSDQVSDTPNQADAHGGCPSFPQVSCSNGPNGDMFMNYMDYVNDACMFMFTNGQSTRMNAMFANGGFRASILNSQGCAGTSGAPVASFTGTPTSVCPGQTVQFTSTSTGTINTYAWTFTGGTPSTSSSQNPTITYNTPGTYSVSLTVTGPGGSNTSTQNAYITVANSSALPLAEGFESTTFPPTNWTITNGDGATTWARTTSASGFGTSSASAFVNCYNYQTTGQKDWLITPAYNFTGVTTGRIKWDYAYTQYQSSYTDSLTVLYSTNCGSTWTTLWTRGGASLATASSTTNNFVPTSSQWKKDSVSLTTLNGQTNVKFAFVCTNDYGNNLFLDNVNIYAVTTGGASPVANFVGNPTTVVVGNSVAFTDLSTNSPTSWAWQFPGAATTTSTQQNPTITYNTIGTYDVTLTATNGNGSNAMTKTNYINVVAGGGSSCDTFSNWTTVALGDTPVLYLSGGWGYLAGHNDWGDLGKAEKFTNTSTMQITGGLYYFGHAHTNNPSTSIITARVWNATGAGGSPGTVLTSQTVLINNISTTGYTFIQFATPANVTSDYFIGFTYTYLAGDTVGLVTTTLNTPNANTGWEQQSGGTWYAYTDANSWGVDLHNAIFPIGCTSTGSTPTASFTASPTGVCPGGTVNFTSTSTGNPTSYNWTFAGGSPSTSTAANPTVTYSATGSYNVILTATNANGSNTSTQNNFVTVYALPSLSTSSNAVACFGQSTGSATVTATGSSPFNFSWSGGGTSATISNKPAGSYTVTVTDAHQCSSTTSVNISQPLSALSGSASGIDASCSQQNGSVTANASGGAGNYTYHWNNNVNTQTASGLGAGTYSVTITDANSCTTTASTTITNTTVTFVVNLNVTNTTCNQNNGAIAVTGSTTGNTYVWSNGGNTNFVSGLAAGNYTVTVTHADGCSASASVAVVNAGSGISLTPSSTTSACAATTGSATVAVNGGTPNYNYIWSNGGNSATINNIGAGSYFVTVTDANNCSSTAVATVSNTNAPSVSVNISAPSCSNSTDGSATATVSGGTPSYTYHWSTGSNNATAGSLAGGTYQLTVGDAANCSAIQSVNVQAPSAVQVNIFVTNTTCGINNGTASVSVQGGMGNYIYQWSNSFFTSSISNLAAGQYTVTVTDGNGCSVTQTSFVTSSSAMNVTISSQNPTTGSSNDGSAAANPVAGTTPYNYSWSNGQTGATATGLSTGTFTVTVTDAIGCTATASVTLVVTGMEELNSVESVLVYPNPSAGNYNVQITNYKNGEVLIAEVFDVSGRKITEQRIVSSVSSLNLSETSSGIYLLKIKSEGNSKIIRLVKE